MILSRYGPLLLVAVSALTVGSNATAYGQAALRVEPRALDFGERGHNERPELRLTLKNAGNRPLVISELKSSCSCLTLRPRLLSEPLDPGTARTVKVTMSSGRAMGLLDKYIAIYTGDGGGGSGGGPRRGSGAKGKPTVKVPARMRVFNGFDMEPRQVRFEGEVGGNAVTETVDIKWTARRLAPPKITFEVERVVPWGAAGKSLGKHFLTRVEDIPRGKRLYLTLKSTHPEGRVAANVRARLNGLPFEVSVAGEMFRGIKVSPNHLNFNRVELDDAKTLEQESKLISISGQPFDIREGRARIQRSPDGDLDAEVDWRPVDGGTKHILRVRLLPGAGRMEGSFYGTVVLKTDHPEKPELELRFFGFFPKK